MHNPLVSTPFQNHPNQFPQTIPPPAVAISARQKIHVSNLPLNVTVHQLQQAFQSYGNIIDIRIIRKTPTGINLQKIGLPLHISCYAFIAFADNDSADKAIKDGGFGDWTVKPQIDRQNLPPQKHRSRSRSRSKDKYRKYAPAPIAPQPYPNPVMRKQQQMQFALPQQQTYFKQDKYFDPNFIMNSIQIPKIDLPQPENQELLNGFLNIPPSELKDLNIFWSGFMFRSKSHRVGVDAKCADIEPPFQMSPQIQVNYKGNFSDAKKCSNEAFKFLLCPSDSTQNGAFQEYIDYFKEKNKIGVAQIGNGVLYLLPPNETTNSIQQISNLELLALYSEDKRKSINYNQDPQLQS